MTKKILSQQKLKQLLRYSPSTGEFFWLEFGYGRPTDKEAGYIDKSTGYRVIGVLGRKYLAHRLAFFYVYGRFPQEQIDHINHLRADNRIKNLREVTRQKNQKNRALNKNNKSGVCGVCWFKSSKKWHAQIQVDRKVINLGLFESYDDACSARAAAEVKYDFHKNHGARA